ncbi:flagellar filament capping protein FliD [Conexibacter sp. SYSU D00693]|uniref:flagellar filament capping protein FliD n=1 Tax=Conexibacter sp. SYSU D00693 TaxID=2812560 RepID=UPI00196A8769|nr:flagellar filament capping protein FliD [Conexibacter sp. SYSU D00693]
MAGLQLGGLVSGMDTSAVIDQLIQVESQGKTRLTLRQTAEQAKQDALKDVQTQLGKLKTAAGDLRSVLLWADKQSVESSSAKVGVRQTAGAGPGGHTVGVVSLATAEQHTFSFTEQAGASSITIGAKTVNLAAGAKVGDAVAAINGDATLGVFAVDVGGKLVLSARTTGEDSAFTASGAGLAEVPGTARPGADAVYTLDGVQKTSPTNVVTDALPGVELTLKGRTTEDADITVGNPGPDAAAVKDKVKAFIEAYNGTVETLQLKLDDKRVANATTTTDAKRGALYGDSGVRAVLSELRGVLGELGGPLGITTGKATGGAASADSLKGKLSFDETAFNEKLAADPLSVRTLLGGGGVDGLAQAVEKVLAPQVEADGILAQRQKGSQAELSSIKSSLDAFDKRLETKEQRLRVQFAAMEAALLKSQSAQSDLANLIASMGSS